MSYKQKHRVWRGRIVQWLIVALFITSIPVVPVHAQGDEQFIVEETVQESLPIEETGEVLEEAVTESVKVSVSETEPRIMAIVPNVGKDVFYYEAEKLNINQVVQSVVLVLEDGTSISCQPWDNVWNLYGIGFSVLDENGVFAQEDEMGKYSIGNYVYKIYTIQAECTCEIPIQVVSLEDVAIELAVGETITELSASDTYINQSLKDGHWIKLNLTVEGYYKISKTSEGCAIGVSPDGKCNYYNYGMNHGLYVSDQIGTYYLYVKGKENFNITVEKVLGITGIVPIVVRDEFYYEVESLNIGQLLHGLFLSFENGTTERCKPWDDVWNSYGINVSILDENGAVAQRDETGKYPIGDYICKITPANKEHVCGVPVHVVSIEDVAVELAVGETVTELSASNKYYDAASFGDGHWFKLNLTEGGTYKISKTSEGGAIGVSPDGKWDYYNNFGMDYRISVPEKKGIYYLYTKGKENFSITMEKVPRITAITPIEARTVAYYELPGDNVVPGLFSYVKITLEDGTIENCRIWDDIWNSYELDMTILDENGVVAQQDETGRYPIGNYVCKITTASEECTCGIPVHVVSLEDVAAELALGETVNDLSASDKYDTWALVNMDTDGHWFKLNLTEAGDYIVSKTSEGCIMGLTLKGMQDYQNFGTRHKISVSDPTEPYYVYAKGTENFSITLEKARRITAITPIVVRDVFYYEEMSYDSIYNMIKAVELTFDDGTKTELTELSELYDYDIGYDFYDTEGKQLNIGRDEYIPVGSYLMRCTTSEGITCEVPFEVRKNSGKITEENLENAVDKILDAAAVLEEKELANANADEKKEVVNRLLQKVEEIYTEHSIVEIGEAAADKAIEFVEKLTKIESQIEELLQTSVMVKGEDEEVKNSNLSVKNALLSVPAGENAELRVSSAEIPSNTAGNIKEAVAFKVELFTDEKLQLQAPVVITMQIPSNVDPNKEIVVYHYKDGEQTMTEKIPVTRENDLMSFVTGSFSTFVITNTVNGAVINGEVSNLGDETELPLVKLLNAKGVEVAQTYAEGENRQYQFKDVNAGKYTLQISMKNHVMREYPVDIIADETELNAELSLKGDICRDGRVNALDKKMLYNHIAGEKVMAGYTYTVGDINGDGSINALDKKMLYNHIAGEKSLWD